MKLTKDLTPELISEIPDEELVSHYTNACQMTAQGIGEELTVEMSVLISVRTLLKEQLEERLQNLRLTIAQMEDQLKGQATKINRFKRERAIREARNFEEEKLPDLSVMD